MNENECRTANWYSLDYTDGMNGSDMANSLSNRSSACAEYNVAVNFNQYKSGYEQGVVAFCTESNGYYVASNGYNYRGICPKNLENQFLKGYQQGRKLNQLRQQASEIKDQLDQAEFDNNYQQSEIKRLKNKLIYDELTPRKRQNILQQLEQFQDNQSNIDHLQLEYTKAKQQIEDFKRSHSRY
ncbi:TPA: DUF2799 domain-containing protein [Photobacterium damselae]